MELYKLIDKHPGLTLKEIHDLFRETAPSLYNERSVNDALLSLRKKGLIYVTSKKKYYTVPL